MFETLSDRIAGTLLTGLDVAVEFATLGEFRLVDPALFPAPAPVTENAAPLVRSEPRRRRGSMSEPVKRTPARTRAGSVRPPAQLCLLTD